MLNGPLNWSSTLQRAHLMQKNFSRCACFEVSGTHLYIVTSAFFGNQVLKLIYLYALQANIHRNWNYHLQHTQMSKPKFSYNVHLFWCWNFGQNVHVVYEGDYSKRVYRHHYQNSERTNLGSLNTKRSFTAESSNTTYTRHKSCVSTQLGSGRNHLL